MKNTHTHTILKHILKKKKAPSTLIKGIRKNKNPERERVLTVLWGKNMDWMRKMISNLYKMKLGEK